MKRTEGKHNSDVSKSDFWKYYKKNIENPINDQKIFNKVFNDIFEGLHDIMVDEGSPVKLIGIGEFRMKAIRPKKILDDGTLNKRGLKVDWNTTKKEWKKLYPNITTIEELKAIKDKPLVYHLNEHTNGYSFMIKWDKYKTTLKGKACYSFASTRAHNRKRAKLILEEGRTYSK